MRHLILTIVAVGIAGVAAVAATTAMLNAPLRIGPAAGTTPTPAQPGQTPAPAEDGAKPASKRFPTRRHRKALNLNLHLRRPPAPSPRAPNRRPKARHRKILTRIPTKASRPKIFRPICNTTLMPA